MRSGVANGVDGAPGVTRRIVRLFVLLGVGVAAYLVLSLFDHAARADVGSLGRNGVPDPVASIKSIPEPQATLPSIHPSINPSIVPKSTAPKTRPPRIHRSTIKLPEVHSRKVQAAKKIHAAKTAVRTTVVRHK